MHAWAHDRFLGDEFKFATDRRLTAYVLGAKPPSDKKSDKNERLVRQMLIPTCPCYQLATMILNQ